MYAKKVQIISPFPPFPLDKLSPMETVETPASPTWVAITPIYFPLHPLLFQSHRMRMDHERHGFGMDATERDNKVAHIEQEQASDKDNNSSSDTKAVEAEILVYSCPTNNTDNKPSSTIPLFINKYHISNIWKISGIMLNKAC